MNKWKYKVERGQVQATRSLTSRRESRKGETQHKGMDGLTTGRTGCRSALEGLAWDRRMVTLPNETERKIINVCAGHGEERMSETWRKGSWLGKKG